MDTSRVGNAPESPSLKKSTSKRLNVNVKTAMLAAVGSVLAAASIDKVHAGVSTVRHPANGHTPMRAECTELTGCLTSTGGCDETGCHVTATVVTEPPYGIYITDGASSAPPPSVPRVWPNGTAQEHLTACAKIYGNTAPNPKFQTYFTQNYGWGSKLSTGGNDTAQTPTDAAPTKAPPGGPWTALNGVTFYSLNYTDLFMNAYTSNAQTVDTLVHEWYHQNHDFIGESQAQADANEQAAHNAGLAAEAAYNANNGASCAGK